jgi:hypothetical protein
VTSSERVTVPVLRRILNVTSSERVTGPVLRRILNVTSSERVTIPILKSSKRVIVLVLIFERESCLLIEYDF